MAFQKVEGLGRDGVAGPATQGRLAAAGRPPPRGGDGSRSTSGRQVLLIVQGGQVQWAINTSTGSGETYTSSSGGVGPGRDARPASFQVRPRGRRRTPRRPSARCTGRSTSTSRSTGRAASRPTRPPTGVPRVTNSAMDMIWASGVMGIGTPVTVY